MAQVSDALVGPTASPQHMAQPGSPGVAQAGRCMSAWRTSFWRARKCGGERGAHLLVGVREVKGHLREFS